MTNSSLSRQVKRFGTPRRFCIILLGFVLFALIFSLEYNYGSKRGDLVGSIIYAIPFSGFFPASLLSLTTTDNKMLQEHVSWHRQYYKLIGLLFLSISLLLLVMLINSLMNNNLPDAVGLPIGGVSFLLMLFVFLRLLVIRRARASEK